MWNKYRLLLLLSLIPGLAFAQLCDGEMGVNALYKNFGEGYNFGPPLTAGTTTYEYTTTIPAPGTYMVSNRTQLNGATWHPGLDHTPNDGFGYMLLFDAGSVPGEFYNVVLDSLCPGTRYEFSAWASNIVTPSSCAGQNILPDIRFELRDPTTNNLLASLETGAIPATSTLRWEKYGMTFSLPQGQDAVRLLLINNAAGGCGNDIALDDIRISVCNPIREQTVVLCSGEAAEVNGKVYSTPGMYKDTIPGVGFCHDSILLTEVRVGGAERTVLDTFICEDGVFMVGNQAYTEPGFYIDTLSTADGCDSVVQLQLTRAQLKAGLVASADRIEMGQTVRLQASGVGEGPLIWSWLTAEGVSCRTCTDVVAQPLEPTKYRLAVHDSLTGCRDTLEQQIHVLPCHSIYTPTAFSPNGDGRNDLFRPLFGDCVEGVSRLEIYNRWGSLVFRSTQADAAWDGYAKGVLCNAGFYIYRAVLLLKNGKKRMVQGELLLLR